MRKIKIAESDEEIENCYAVMAELRPHITQNEFLETLKRLTENFGFQLVYLFDGGDVKSVGGFRISEWLAANILKSKTLPQKANSVPKVTAASFLIGFQITPNGKIAPRSNSFRTSNDTPRISFI